MKHSFFLKWKNFVTKRRKNNGNYYVHGKFNYLKQKNNKMINKTEEKTIFF